MRIRSFLSGMVIATCLFAQGKPGDPGSQGKGDSNGSGSPSGGSGSPSTPAKPEASITWLTTEADIDQALLATGTANVKFQSSADLQNIQVWLTPSLTDVTPLPAQFATILKNTVYTIALKMPKLPDHTLGGTLHLRADDSHSYAAPLPINIQVNGGGTQKNATVAAVVNGANYQKGSVTPGQVVTLFGSGIGPDSGAGLQLDVDGRVSSYLGETLVLFNGIPAPLLAVSSGQVNAVVPQGIASDTAVDIVLTFRGSISPTVTLPVTPASPALFTLDGSGHGPGAILNQDGTVNSSTQPAARGSIVTLFGSGFGPWSQPVPDGTVMGANPPTLKSPVSVKIGGVLATVHYAGGAPGVVSAVAQINVEIPADTQPGDKVTISIDIGGQSSPDNVTVSVN